MNKIVKKMGDRGYILVLSLYKGQYLAKFTKDEYSTTGPIFLTFADALTAAERQTEGCYAIIQGTKNHDFIINYVDYNTKRDYGIGFLSAETADTAISKAAWQVGEPTIEEELRNYLKDGSSLVLTTNNTYIECYHSKNGLCKHRVVGDTIDSVLKTILEVDDEY